MSFSLEGHGFAMFARLRTATGLLFAWSAAFVACGSSEPDPGGGAGNGGSVTSAGSGQSGAGSGGAAQGGSGGSAPNGAGDAGRAPAAGAGNGGAAQGGGAPGGAGNGGAGGVATVSYRSSIAPIFEANGCVLCHYTGSLVIDIEAPFTPVTGLVDSANTWAAAHPEGNTPARNVLPGDPDNSFLLHKVAAPALDAATAGEPMPWQIPRLTEAELGALRDWVAAGAQNDDTFANTVRPIFGREGSFSGKCVHCHFSEGQRPNLQDPFDPETGAVGVMASRSTQLLIAPGDPDASFLVTKVSNTSLPPAQGMPMPAQFPRLLESEVEALRTWISQGALDN